MTDPNRNQERLLSFRAVFALAGVFYNTSTVSSKYLTFILFLLFVSLPYPFTYTPAMRCSSPFLVTTMSLFFLARAWLGWVGLGWVGS